jgi:dolichol-phosphate mannosyltransferase
METTGNLIPRDSPRLISFVLPVFDEEEVLPILRQRILELKKHLPCELELIFVNDGSRDGSAKFLVNWARLDRRVKVLHFSRNFGHQAATTAGLDHANGDAIVVLDADLQDPPELVLEMLELYKEGYDVIYAQRSSREGETLFKRWTAGGFYWLMRRFVHKDLPENVGDFRLMSREVVQALCSLREGQRFIRGLVTWLGFNQTAIVFERPHRAGGRTKFSTVKMCRFALDGILSFSRTPLRASAYLGLFVCLFGLGVGAYTVFLKLFFKNIVPGWSSVIIVQALLGGSILISLGLIGEYIGRIYEEIKQRPLYIVSWALNIEKRTNTPRVIVPFRDTEQDVLSRNGSLPLDLSEDPNELNY